MFIYNELLIFSALVGIYIICLIALFTFLSFLCIIGDGPIFNVNNQWYNLKKKKPPRMYGGKVNVDVKVKSTLERATKASRGIALLFL